MNEFIGGWWIYSHLNDPSKRIVGYVQSNMIHPPELFGEALPLDRVILIQELDIRSWNVVR